MRPDLDLYVPRGVALAEQRALRPEVVERRDPSAATRQLQYVSPRMVQAPAWDAERAFRFGYIANVIAYRCVQLRANALANVPIVVGPKRGLARVDQENSPLARLLGPPPGGPAPKLSARKLIRWTIAQQIVTGRRGWEIETQDGSADGLPVAFWPLVSSALDARPSSGGVEWFSSFRYGRWGDKRELPTGRVFYGWAPSGDDFRQAESALQAARYDLSLVTMADRYQSSFLANNAVPAAVVTTEKFPTPEHRERFMAQWSSEFSGPSNAGRIHLNEVDDDGSGPVGDAIDIKILGLSQQDAQLAESRKTALMEVAISLGTPWSKLDASGRTFDNAEVEDRSWWEDTNEPDMSDLEDDINMQLAPRLGSDVCWFDRSQVRALKRKIIPVTASASASAMVHAQLMWINEARADYGLDPVEGGDRMMTVEEIQDLKTSASDQSIRAALIALESRGAGGAAVSDPADPLAEVTPPPAPEPVEDRGPSAEDIEARRAKVWRTADAIVTTLEGRWERSLRRLFERQATATLARLKGKRGRQMIADATGLTPGQVLNTVIDEAITRTVGTDNATALAFDGQALFVDGTRAPDPAPQVDPAAIFDPKFWTDETRQIVADLFEGVTAEGLARVADAFGLSFDLSAPWVGEFIDARANMLAGQVTDTTYQAVTTALREGVEVGASIDDLAARIREVFDVASKSRATVIARTEVLSAYNGAAVQGAASLPADVVGGQEWIATRDGRTRAAHASADGQVVPIGQPFDVGGDELAYPGDPSGRAKNTIQCRCTVAFLTPAEMEAVTGQPARMADHRHTRAMFDLITPETNLLAFRRALEANAA